MNGDDMLAGLPDGLHRLTLADGLAAIAKVRRGAPRDFFAAESRGFAALRSTHAVRVPAIFSVDPCGIVLEDLGSGHAEPGDWERAGRGLARLHGEHSPTFGFARDGWCGDSPQDNTHTADGHRFFAERRLQPQARRACANHLLPSTDASRIDRICDRLEHWIPPSPPVLIHGDLWTGNLHACANGELALIDAGAVHHGWAEADLAMLTLFGEPPRAFFATYESESEIASDWRERVPLYNLYHLLNHLNLFGASYLDAVRAILRRYS